MHHQGVISHVSIQFVSQIVRIFKIIYFFLKSVIVHISIHYSYTLIFVSAGNLQEKKDGMREDVISATTKRQTNGKAGGERKTSWQKREAWKW